MSHNTDILAQNYTYLKSKSELLSDAMEGIFSEAAVLWEDLMKNPPTPDDVSRIFNEITGKTSDILSVEFADLCLAFAEHYESSLETLFDDDIVESIATPKIAYLQNSFSNRAYRSFSRVFDKVSSVYFSGFREVCEEVYYGRASHAILPVFSTHDGPLISFRKLI